MADDENRAGEAERANALKKEKRAAKKREGKAKRQELVRKGQLKALRRARKTSGQVAKKTGGTAADVGVQGTIAVGRAGLEAGEKALDVVTSGAYTPIDIATTVGGSVFQKGAGKTAKKVTGEVAKQGVEAPFRVAEAVQKRRIKGAKKRKARAKAEGKAIDKALAQDKGAPERMGRFLVKGLTTATLQTIAVPFEIALSLIMMVLFPIILVLLMLYIVVLVIPGPILKLLSLG